LELERELGDQQLGLQRRVADGLGAERVEVGSQVAVRAVGLDQGRRGGDCPKQRLVRLSAGGRLRLAGGLGLGLGFGLGFGRGHRLGRRLRRRSFRRRRRDRHGLCGGLGSCGWRAVLLQRLEQASETGERLDE
jgi:hypothetical protein